MIKAKVPQADVNGVVGRRTSFEVSIDDTVVHSKLQTMAFPDFDEVVDITSDVEIGNPVRQISKTHSDGCTSFEVTVNDTVVFSKLERGGFPDNEEIVAIVIAAEAGGAIGTAQKSKSSCTIF
ncbi:Migration and invasion enhancer 1-like [Homarus americanus]|uniref:Migration and invasion enhancer 1-like n=1 Tax=Homarus americanus TaxID=6706 RepID=A0A8J5TLG2_HOMAM|nr:Migration and invasion enhancer 1-like [Homarus americanus]